MATFFWEAKYSVIFFFMNSYSNNTDTDTVTNIYHIGDSPRDPVTDRYTEGDVSTDTLRITIT